MVLDEAQPVGSAQLEHPRPVDSEDPGDDEWLGRVIYAAQHRPGEWSTLEEWLPAKPLVAGPAED